MATTKVVNAGLAQITNRFKGSGTEPVYIGWGSGTGTTVVANTTLFIETDTDGSTTASVTRTTGTSTQQTTTATNDTWQLTGTRTLVTAASFAVTNSGCFDQAALGGNCFIKGDFSTINLNTGDSIAYTIKAVYVSG